MATRILPSQYSHNTGSLKRLGVQIQNVPDRLEIGGYDLIKVARPSIKIFETRQLVQVIDANNPVKASLELEKDFANFINEYGDLEIKPTGLCRLVERSGRAEVLMILAIPKLAQLFEILCQKYKVFIAEQPAYMTIYMLPMASPIAVASQEEMTIESRLVNIPELKNLEIV